MMMTYGIKPSYIIGHSLKDYMTDCIDGSLDIEDALRSIVKMKNVPAEEDPVSITDRVRELSLNDKDMVFIEMNSILNGHITEHIGRLWSLGIDIDWNAYYGTEKRRRVSLPAYSFEPVKYPTEVDPFSEISFFPTEPAEKGNSEDPKDWIYYPTWKRTVMLPAEVNAGDKTVLFFSSGDDFCISLRSEILKSGSGLVEVFAGEEYTKPSKGKFFIDAVRPDHFRRLFSDLQDEDMSIGEIIYHWGAGADLPGHQLNFFAISRLARALTAPGGSKIKRITILTDAA
jgi:polyketide synthase PksN